MTDDGVVVGADGIARCWWPGDDPAYLAYHDDEWGRPTRDERDVFELLALEGFQAGLAWITILRKRPAFRDAFAGFDIATVAAFDEPDIVRLLGDAGIVRHRGKIEATIDLARLSLDLQAEGTSLSEMVWSFAPAAGRDDSRRPSSMADVAAHTAESTALSVALKARGARFVGPTIVYAFMQSAGMVDDHLVGCHRAG
ncbi:DNA-3-methyladenine glycosylase I [Thalassobaculum salexigens]|uniref:DNA-3-methyladenine glycosylase I n=1 Tax=Thalassobaculum salexigens TaxID=455360 RepID=UPI00248EBD11|nr:DNA-3-methyladenine glycosylase I [Thalassobaculum salexigens]